MWIVDAAANAHANTESQPDCGAVADSRPVRQPDPLADRDPVVDAISLDHACGRRLGVFERLEHAV